MSIPGGRALYVATEKEDSLLALCKESESERNGGCQKCCEGQKTFDIH